MSRHQVYTSRRIVERWLIEGQLVLTTPAHFGNGDADRITDMPLLVDEATGRALLPGTSVAGALRAYLRELLLGFGRATLNRSTADQSVIEWMGAVQKLLGGEKGDDDGEQSCLIIDDALGPHPRIDLRDGVRIAPDTRTAYMERVKGEMRGFKYDVELLEAGTTFDLRMELLIPEQNADEPDPSLALLKPALVVALDGLAQGEIRLGLRKRRGLGRCGVPGWTVTRYDLGQVAGLKAFLTEGRDGWASPGDRRSGKAIGELLSVTLPKLPERREVFTMKVTLGLSGSMLIRSGFGQQDLGPDTVHLHARQAPREQPDGGAKDEQNDDREPVISGTSLAGVVRGRARRIARTIAGDRILPNGQRGVKRQVESFIDAIFGPAKIEKGDRHAYASRLIVDESIIAKGRELVQNRIRIDRFTGGAYESALFTEQPLFGNAETAVKLSMELRNPTDAEIGLLLLVLKDLWTGDLPVGGESSVGRGRLRGMEATLKLKDQEWHIVQADPEKPVTVNKGDTGSLNRYVEELWKELQA